MLGLETSSPRSALKQAERADRIEALACGKCGSINVRVNYARDYCLKCAECGRFTPLAYVCPLCGKHATIRKDGPEYFCVCDGTGGCGRATVFSRE